MTRMILLETAMPDSESSRSSEPGYPEIPRRLDDVVRANREKLQLRLATDAEIVTLTRVIPFVDELNGEISDWRFVAFTSAFNNQRTTHLRVLGNNARRGVGVKITSPIVALDPGSGLVATRRGSIYRLVGKGGVGEPTVDQLLLVCAALWHWGVGDGLRVPFVDY